MKKITTLIVCLSVFISCKKENKPEQNIDLTLIKGEFVYYDGAAILQTNSKIYGVLVTDKLLELDKLAEQYKKLPTDMVNVEIKGRVTNKKDDKILWENKVEIVEILNVIQPNSKENNVVKPGNE